jgi:hypothetical protein
LCFHLAHSHLSPQEFAKRYASRAEYLHQTATSFAYSTFRFKILLRNVNEIRRPKNAPCDRLILEDHPTESVEVLEVALFPRGVRVSSFIKPKSLDGDDVIAGRLISMSDNILNIIWRDRLRSLQPSVERNSREYHLW